ncbi:inactive transglutaminase family protein [Thioalkalivibrio thiocyanodenitrificans]|uniref:inactive transglutaminase family protein n=1 Tax=Thioalkalivibrio thiocyanodenitrificans TaxID=243063 RepID=UPI00036586A6|nr:inactive transglutaminase family protein [Thioalkalivibrio thiocyanodenitrificans]
MRRLHLTLLVLGLLATSLVMVGYKVSVLGFPLQPAQTVDNWIVEARVAFEPSGGAVTARLMLPDDPPGYGILDENFVSRGYGLTTTQQGENREARWTTRTPSGRQVIYYRATVYEHPGSNGDDAPYPGPVSVPDYGEPYHSAAMALLESVRERSADITSFASVLVNDLNAHNPGENAALFIDRDASETDRVRTVIDLLAGARIPTRMVHGITLTDWTREAGPQAWLEVHNTREWVPVNPRDGTPGYPPNFLVWWRGDMEPLQVDRAERPEISFSVTRNIHDAIDVAEQRAQIMDSRIVDFSLFGLPVQTQNMYRVLLMVPVGALIIVLLRNMVGIQTFGTFMPVLIALSFRETRLVGGIVLFTLIVSLGLAIRFYLEHLKLLLVPRLAAVVIVVIMLMALISILSHNLGIEQGLSLALFPIVILAMTIERMSIVWEEHGPQDAIYQGLGSLAVAAASYLFMINRNLEHLIFVFPELLLVVLALTLLVGRYTGYRLTELVRFRALKE